MRTKIIVLRLSEFRFNITHYLPAKLNRFAMCMEILGLILAIYDLGFHRVEAWQLFVNQAYRFLIVVFGSLFLLRLGFHKPPKVSLPLFIAEVSLILVLGFA